MDKGDFFPPVSSCDIKYIIQKEKKSHKQYKMLSMCSSLILINLSLDLLWRDLYHIHPQVLSIQFFFCRHASTKRSGAWHCIFYIPILHVVFVHKRRRPWTSWSKSQWRHKLPFNPDVHLNSDVPTVKKFLRRPSVRSKTLSLYGWILKTKWYKSVSPWCDRSICKDQGPFKGQGHK